MSGTSYCVMQSDGKSYGVDVVLDSFNLANRDEGSIRGQKYGKQIFWNLYYEDYKIQE